MKTKFYTLLFFISFTTISFSQIQDPNFNIANIPAVGIVKNINDSTLLDIVQRQTFRFFWHYAHPVSGLARERSNTIRGEYFWDYADEAYGSPNFSKNILDTNVCAIGGSGFGIMATIVVVNRGWIGRDTAVGRLIQIRTLNSFMLLARCYKFLVYSKTKKKF